MEKQKRWQFYLIIAVLALTLYNILPTLFYYSKPLKSPIDEQRAAKIEQEIAERVNSLEVDAVEWIGSFNKLIGIKAQSIALNESNPRFIDVQFSKPADAKLFRKLLPKAGELIPFSPSQLDIFAADAGSDTKVRVIRQIGLHIDKDDMNNLFTFIEKFDENKNLSQDYQNIIKDRIQTIALAVGSESPMNSLMKSVLEGTKDPYQDDLLINLASQLNEIERLATSSPTLSKRLFHSLAQGSDHTNDILKLQGKFDALKNRLDAKKTVLVEEIKKHKTESAEETLAQIEKNIQAVTKAASLLKKHEGDFKTAKPLLARDTIKEEVARLSLDDGQTVFKLGDTNPYIEALVIDIPKNAIEFKFYDDVEIIRNESSTTETASYLKDKLNSMIFNEIARIGRVSDEEISPSEDSFAIQLSDLPDSKSFLALNLGYAAEKTGSNILNTLKNQWHPQHPDLSSGSYALRGWNEYQDESKASQKLGLVVYAPSLSKEAPPKGFRKGSIYVIARGLNLILDKAKANDSKELSELLEKDLGSLKETLTQFGFIGYPGSSYGLGKDYAKDYIFELDDYYSSLLNATRENFTVSGSKNTALLPFTDVEQRIITWNKIQDKIQENLVKWKDDYGAAQVNLDLSQKYTVPAPTENPYWSNFKLNAIKYFSGDDRKILKWGLDLSGGKTVRIGLTDKNNRPVTNPDEIKQTVNELYTRINKMGVSERTIRVENNNIVLEFPGSQALSANDLVQASTMYFHVVNEKFSPGNTALASAVNQFLQGVWNEAVVTNRKSEQQINEIAWQHLGGANGVENARPVSDIAKTLIENGLVLADPRTAPVSNTYNDEISKIAILRGEDYTDWMGNTHPLMFVFHNYALDGSSLANIQTSYDSTQGNSLNFSVKRSYEGPNAPSGSPRDDLFAWTSQFSEEKIQGTSKELFTNGKGWRMAVILNGTVISQPELKAALKDNASITGRFTQREVNQLAADLKAGSLSFTPRILSEQNVSAELGEEERSKGITASLIAVILVGVVMISYYRFAGLVATCAVLINILIMWGVLQNLDAALTLPGIAGIVLTIGMAVDANVLVFERIREEFAISGRIASAIQAGYRKAFTAIFDSNITTIMAALILIQFDSGPIKGFAVTLIIGIFSSMFTALFMTRYFFAGWVKNPANKRLNMSQLISNTRFNFISKAKSAAIISLVVMIVGMFFLVQERKTIFGMDFTGGYSLAVEVEPESLETSYRQKALEALHKMGASSTDVQVRELNLPNQLRISLGRGMDEKGHPFYGMPLMVSEESTTYDYQQIPRLAWVVKSLEEGGLKISDFQKTQLEGNWSQISGQFSDQMIKNAIMGLGLALLSILIYITLRFEFKYAVAAVVGLAHDVIITLGILAIFYKLGFPVQIDLQVVGALMTIIGYSLNDTIIIFDRVREDLKLMKRMSYYEVINHALNVTLSRTLMTSGTTLVVLITLVLFGGQSIFAFSLVMTIGVLIGTLSSLFIAAPTVLWLHNREHGSKETLTYRNS